MDEPEQGQHAAHEYAQQPELPSIEETPATHPHLFIAVHRPELVIITEGNNAGLEVATGRVLVSFRRRTADDPVDATFVVEPAQSRLRHEPTGEPVESYRSYVNSVMNHTQEATGARKWVGEGAHVDPPRPARRLPTDHGTRSCPLHEDEGTGWL